MIKTLSLFTALSSLFLASCASLTEPFELQDKEFAARSEKIDLDVNHEAMKWYNHDQRDAIMSYKKGWTTVDKTDVPYFSKDKFKQKYTFKNINKQKRKVEIELGSSTWVDAFSSSNVSEAIEIYDSNKEKIGSFKFYSDENLYDMDIEFKNSSYHSRDITDEPESITSNFINELTYRLISLKKDETEIARVYFDAGWDPRRPVNLYLVKGNDALKNDVIEIIAYINLLGYAYIDYHERVN